MFELGTSRRYLQPMTFVRSLLFENSICGFAFISFFISAKEVMFSSAFVCLLAGLRKSYSIWWKNWRM